jgi:hypothetical protein
MIYPTSYLAPMRDPDEVFACDTCDVPIASDSYTRVCDPDSPFECVECSDTHTRTCKICQED